MSDLGNGLDLPFEKNPEPFDRALAPDARISGGVVVLAAVAPVADVGVKPALIFRFATPTGGFYPDMLLVLDDDQLTKVPVLVRQAVDAAREATARSQS